jgi:hypothetical protein
LKKRDVGALFHSQSQSFFFVKSTSVLFFCRGKYIPPAKSAKKVEGSPASSAEKKKNSSSAENARKKFPLFLHYRRFPVSYKEAIFFAVKKLATQ